MLINQPSLSLAWAEAFLAIRKVSGHRLSPLALTFTGFGMEEPLEDQAIHEALDTALEAAGMQSIQTVANTIFPQVLWRRAKGDRQALYAAYRENLPDYVAMETTHNKRGLYFGRLIAFGLNHKTGERLPQFPEGSLREDGNQLEVIIKQCAKGVQTIKLQASVFDPGRDHVTDARVGFPCLQHVTFVPCFAHGTLVMNSFYATQQLFMKGYARDHKSLEGVKSVDYQLLKAIRIMASSFEVAVCTTGEWERAIFMGYDAWKLVQKNQGGKVELDLDHRTIKYLGM